MYIDNTPSRATSRLPLPFAFETSWSMAWLRKATPQLLICSIAIAIAPWKRRPACMIHAHINSTACLSTSLLPSTYVRTVAVHVRTAQNWSELSLPMLMLMLSVQGGYSDDAILCRSISSSCSWSPNWTTWGLSIISLSTSGLQQKQLS